MSGCSCQYVETYVVAVKAASHPLEAGREQSQREQDVTPAPLSPFSSPLSGMANAFREIRKPHPPQGGVDYASEA